MEIIRNEAAQAIRELLDTAALEPGRLVVVGCSSSEILGEAIGSHSSYETALSVFEAIYAELKRRNLYLAAQCCEHLNRALVIEREAASGADIVNAVP